MIRDHPCLRYPVGTNRHRAVHVRNHRRTVRVIGSLQGFVAEDVESFLHMGASRGDRFAYPVFFEGNGWAIENVEDGCCAGDGESVRWDISAGDLIAVAAVAASSAAKATG